MRGPGLRHDGVHGSGHDTHEAHQRHGQQHQGDPVLLAPRGVSAALPGVLATLPYVSSSRANQTSIRTGNRARCSPTPVGARHGGDGLPEPPRPPDGHGDEHVDHEQNGQGEEAEQRVEHGAVHGEEGRVLAEIGEHQAHAHRAVVQGRVPVCAVLEHVGHEHRHGHRVDERDARDGHRPAAHDARLHREVDGDQALQAEQDGQAGGDARGDHAAVGAQEREGQRPVEEERERERHVKT